MYSLDTIITESEKIFELRNAPFGLNSDSEINLKDYRRYDDKNHSLLRLGFNIQLFSILYLTSSSFVMLNLGIGFVSEVDLIPWLDLNFLPILFAGNQLIILTNKSIFYRSYCICGNIKGIINFN